MTLTETIALLKEDPLEIRVASILGGKRHRGLLISSTDKSAEWRKIDAGRADELVALPE